MILLYIDPGTGSMLISAIVALFSVAFFMIKGFVYRKFSIGGTKGIEVDPTKNYGLVFFSEGGQYWNVFKPLLEELESREVRATYFTSSKDDPGLNSSLKNVDSFFIGTGREAYYFLNRLNAEMVVMTTPGLDVLQIKRSKNVKHYCHVTHAAAGISGYKTYGTDYYDSVLVGGEADKNVILELESKRNIKKKEVEIIGCTYLDAYRDKLKNKSYEYDFFPTKKTTVLVSPTWGNHGLLNKYGEDILSKLEQSNLFNVIIRPHPQSFVSEKQLLDGLMDKFPSSESRVWDREHDGLKAMSHADIMISDFSGIIFDFLFLFQKPVLTMHGHYEKRGRDAIDLEGEPWDLSTVKKVGKTIEESDINNLPEIINSALSNSEAILEKIAEAKEEMDKYPTQAGRLGADFITKKINNQKESPSEQKDSMNSSSAFIESENISANKEIGIKGYAQKLFNTFFHPSTFLQLTFTLIMLNGYFFVGNKFLPEGGLNQHFIEKLFGFLQMFSVFILFSFIVLIWIKGREKFVFKKKGEPIVAKDFILLALPLTPIMQYILANQNILSFLDSFIIFGLFFIISSVCCIIIPWILSPLVSQKLTRSVSLSFVFTILNMANIGNKVALINIAIMWVVIFVGIYLLLFFRKKYLLIAFILFFITNVGFSAVKSYSSNNQQVNTYPSSKISEITSGLTLKNTPDIYFLIYESYSNRETMDFYGFDNSNQTEYLRDKGFKIYDGTYTIGPATLVSMAHVLTSDLISKTNNLPQFRKAIAEDGPNLFNNLGYTTHSVLDSDFYTRGYFPQYDYNFPKAEDNIDSYDILINAILEGEFRFNAKFSNSTYDTYLEEKRSVLSQNLNSPEFMYTHNKYPNHSQNSGVLLPNETEIYIDGVNKANEEMKKDLDYIDLENRDAIVIIAGDHGPYLTKNGIGLSSYNINEIDRYDVQDRYGAFLAIYWPDEEYAEKFDIQILQDVLPAAFSYMYEDESLFDKLRMERETLRNEVIGGVVVRDGIIYGGKDDGKPLFKGL